VKWSALGTVLATALAPSQIVITPALGRSGDKQGFENPDSGRHEQNLTKADVELLGKELSNWGRWGVSDERGSVHLITPAKRIEAAALVRKGLSVSLAHNDSTETSVDNNPPYGHKMLSTGDDPSAMFAFDQYVVAFHTEFITHLDALSHVFDGDKLYNGFPRQSVTTAGSQKLDVLQFKNGIFTRGILFDIPRLKGRPYLEPGEAIYPEDLDRWGKMAGVKVEPGDVVLIRTGRWARRAKLGPFIPSAGLHVSCARWLHKHDIAVLGSDAKSDVMPSGVDGVAMPIHLLVIASMGTPILDNLDLEQLADVAAAQHRWVFLFTVAPEPVPGGTGSPVNPTAVY
jgi:kynurenine formamidase